ncbi:MAG: hypothetical protein ACKV22_14765 [Bryobacteraceae bacterium]
MDLKKYYEKIREVRESIEEEFPAIVSLETSDGGRAGRLTEVTRDVAARMVAEEQARLASPDEAALFRTEKAEAKKAADQAAAASRVHVAVLSEREMRSLREVRDEG